MKIFCNQKGINLFYPWLFFASSLCGIHLTQGRLPNWFKYSLRFLLIGQLKTFSFSLAGWILDTSPWLVDMMASKFG